MKNSRLLADLGGGRADETWEKRLQHYLKPSLLILDDFAMKMVHSVKMKEQSYSQDVRRLRMQLQALSPLAVLNRGYSITRNSKGDIVRSVADIKTGQHVTTRLAKGMFESEVRKTEEI